MKDTFLRKYFVPVLVLIGVAFGARYANAYIYNPTGGSGGGTGTVTGVSVATANGLAGTSDGNAATPTLTLSTTVTGLLKGNGTSISAAVAGTDYQAPLTNPVTGTGVTGQVSYWSGTATQAGSNNLFWLNASSFLGLNTAAPTHTLTLGSTSTGISYYNTSDQTTNYERGLFSWVSNAFTLQTQNGGTGTQRNITITAPVTTITNDMNIIGNIFSSSATFGTGNLGIESGSVGYGRSNQAGSTFAGAGHTALRAYFNGQAVLTMQSTDSYANLLIGSGNVSTPATGTTALLANLVVNPIGTVTSGGATVTQTATEYIGGQQAGGTQNYLLLANGGTSYLGGFGTAIATLTATTNTMTLVQQTVLCDATTGAQTDTLPTAASAFNTLTGEGSVYDFEKIDSSVNSCTLKGNGSEIIGVGASGGANTKAISTQGTSVEVISNGTQWFIK